MTRTARLVAVLVLNLLLVGVLVAVGVTAHSLGVLAEGADYLADSAAIAVSLLAIWLAARPATARRPYGYPRATGYAALVNAGWLVLLTVLVAVSAVDRLVSGVPVVRGVPVLVISGVAAAMMIAGAVILSGDPDEDGGASAGGALNLRAVLLDTLADAASAAGVAVAGAVIAVSGGLYWLDPAIAVAVAAVVGYHALRLLREVVTTLGRPVPHHVPEDRDL